VKVADVPIEKVKPYPGNPRKNADAVAKVASSLATFGWRQPIVVDEDNVVIAGHTRLLAAQQLGHKTVPVHVATGLTADQIRAYRLADNRVAQEAEWDDDLLAQELLALTDAGFDLSLTGFDDDELSQLLSEQSAVLEGADLDEVPEPPAEPITKPGDRIVLGRHTLICGDSTDSLVWDALGIPPNAMVFTSPPYGVGTGAKLRDHYVPGKEERTSFYVDHDDDPGTWPDLMTAWTNNALTSASVVVCNVQQLAGNKRALVEWMHTYRSHLVDVAVWDKNGGAPQMQSNVMTNAFEWIVILSAQENASRSVPLADFHGNITNVVRVDSRGKNDFAGVHRAVMPVDLALWALSLCADAAAVVDPFSGTGTTLMAAESKGKRALCIELSPAYCDVIVKRWETATGKTAVRPSV
jgi:hypothetical protein